MPPLPYWTALTTLVIVAEYYCFSFLVFAARRRTGIWPPAMVGAPELERAVRVHLNTLEKLVVVVPCAWIVAWTLGDVPAGAAAGAWAVTRLIYAVGYLRSAAGRTLGAVLGDAVEVGVIGMAVYGVLSGAVPVVR